MRLRLAGAVASVRDERGMGIVEVVVAGLILVVVALGAGAAFSSAGARSTETRTRAVASSLAAQDQARMRTMQVVDSSGFVEDRTVTVGGTPYTVRSTARWLNDAGPEATCDAQAGVQPAAIQITSRVTSNVATAAPSGGARISPVTLRSLVSPPRRAYSGNTGTLAVPVVGRDRSTPVSGVTVSISGPRSASLPTNAAGCAVFGQVPPGFYVVVLDQPGWVGVTGAQRVTAERIEVRRGELARQAATPYQLAGAVDVAFTRSGVAAGTSLADGITVRNDAIGSTPKVVTLSPAASTGRVDGLFPATQAHTVYAGRCVPADTTKGVAQVVDPGSTASVNVPQAPLDARIANATAANQPVFAIWQETDCFQRVALQRQGTSAVVARSSGDTSLPFGRWRLCVNKTANTFVQTPIFTLASDTANDRQRIDVNATGLNGQCRVN